MKPKDRQKICSHCDGRIAVEADNCLYCGMPLLEEKAVEKEEPKSIMDMLYAPPYKKAPPQPAAPIAMVAPEEKSAATAESVDSIRPVVLSLLGSNLLVLGLMQFFFSEGGILRLEWSAKYWFLFLSMGAGLLYISTKKKK